MTAITMRAMYSHPENTQAVLYLHGFASSPKNYFYPDELRRQRPKWDAAVIGYPTGYCCADYPRLQTIVYDLQDALEQSELSRYKSFVFVGNSVGGVIALKAVLQSERVSARVKALLLFGSPVGGVKYNECAWWQRLLKPILRRNRQVQDLEVRSPFMADLQSSIRARASNADYNVVAVTGGKDMSVRSWSSEDPVLRFKHVTVDRLPNARHFELFTVPIVATRILRATEPRRQA